MVIFDSNDSPFMTLWYLYLLFLGAVIAVNIVALLIKSVITWRTNKLLAIPRKRGAK